MAKRSADGTVFKANGGTFIYHQRNPPESGPSFWVCKDCKRKSFVGQNFKWRHDTGCPALRRSGEVTIKS